MESHFENFMMEKVSSNKKKDIPESKQSSDVSNLPLNKRNNMKIGLENVMIEEVSSNEKEDIPEIKLPLIKRNKLPTDTKIKIDFENFIMEKVSSNESENIHETETSLYGFQLPLRKSKNVLNDNKIVTKNVMKEKVYSNEKEPIIDRSQIPLSKRKKFPKKKEIKTDKSKDSFQFSPYLIKSPEKVDLKLTAEEDLISDELDLSPTVSLNFSENESPLNLELNYKLQETHHIDQLSQKESQLSHTSEFSSPVLLNHNRIPTSKSCLKGILPKKINKKFPRIDKDLQDVMQATCEFLHSSWDSEQKKNLISAEKCHDLTQNIISQLNKDLREFKSTEESTVMLWTQVIEKLKKHRISQENQLKRLRLSHSVLKTSLLQSQEYQKSHQKILQSALKQDMNALQKKFFAKINENSLKAVRQCLLTSAIKTIQEK
ncbi:hypothetical protein Btru_056439 [Bulinus truncatus]|nr:hypothetical protein Btru_056439 [Bulinus truncatus]